MAEGDVGLDGQDVHCGTDGRTFENQDTSDGRRRTDVRRADREAFSAPGPSGPEP